MCSIERVGLDLVDRVARRELFERIWVTSTKRWSSQRGSSVTLAWTRPVA